MASKNIMLGTGAALAGLGGLAAAAVTVDTSEPAPAAQPVPKVETRTVVIRTVEHRVKRVQPKHARAHAAPTPAAVPAAQPAPVVQLAPTRVATAPPATANSAPIRTRASGGSGSGRGDDGAEHEAGGHGGDDAAEHADD